MAPWQTDPARPIDPGKPWQNGSTPAKCLAIDVAGSIRSHRLIDILAQLISVHGAPRDLRSDNGPELVSHAILQWLAEAGIGTALIDPGRPWQNGPTKASTASCATNASA